MLISDKINLKTKIVLRAKKALYNDKRVNPPRRPDNYKHI